MLRFGFRSPILHVPLVISESAGLIPVVVPRDRQDRHAHLFVLLRRRRHRVVIRVWHRMRHPLLKNSGRIPCKLVVTLIRRMRHIHLARFSSPKAAAAEKARITCHAAGERQPLHIVGAENVVLKRKIHAGMRCGRGNNRCQVRRKLLQHRPLIKSRVGTSPHRHLAVAIRLFCQPFNDIVSVAAFIFEWPELSARIAAPAHVH